MGWEFQLEGSLAVHIQVAQAEGMAADAERRGQVGRRVVGVARTDTR